MAALDSFHPFLDTPETANPTLGCSARYFEIEGSTLGAGWYGQGLRLVDISNARNVRQVGYFRVTGTDNATNPSSNSWDMEFKEQRRKGDLVYLFDMNRGVEILRMEKGAHHSADMKSVTAPSVTADRFAPQAVSSLSDSGGTGFVCPLFV